MNPGRKSEATAGVGRRTATVPTMATATKSWTHADAGVPRSGAHFLRPGDRSGQRGPGVYGAYVDELVAQVNNGTRYYAAANHLFSVAAITDAAGAVVQRNKYDAYGKRSVTGAAVSARGFTGYREDAETGLYYARARMYSAGLGRFIGRDPLGYINGFSSYFPYFAPRGLDPTGTVVSRHVFQIAERFVKRVSDETFWDVFTVERQSVSGYYYNWSAITCTCDEWKETHYVSLKADRSGKRSYDLYVGGSVTVDIDAGMTAGGTALGWASLSLDVFGAFSENNPFETVTDSVAVGLDFMSLFGDWSEVTSAVVVDQNIVETRKNESFDGVILSNFRLDTFDDGSGGAVTGVKLNISKSDCETKDKAGRQAFKQDKATLVASMQGKLNAINSKPAGAK
jgi:RHS repeat-associated protein